MPVALCSVYFKLCLLHCVQCVLSCACHTVSQCVLSCACCTVYSGVLRAGDDRPSLPGRRDGKDGAADRLEHLRHGRGAAAGAAACGSLLPLR